jgi:hypothetical protein
MRTAATTAVSVTVDSGENVTMLHRRPFALCIAIFILQAAVAGCTAPDPDTLDFDGDGVPDIEDAFPADPTEVSDRDGDGVGDNSDAFPDDPDRSTGDPNEGPDTDGDGTPDRNDPEPNNPDVSSLPAPTNPLGGEPGVAVSGLSAGQIAQFEAGKATYDRTFTPMDGLGPGQAATGCSACHGALTASAAPGVVSFRVDDGAGGTVTVARKASTLFGVGLLERIGSEEFMSRHDPEDADGNGISGRARFIPDEEGVDSPDPTTDEGRFGRFGRKAQAADLESLIEDMLRLQMGVTTGAGLDADEVADPELPTDELGALVAFQANLAAPLRDTIDLGVVRGGSVFESVGCGNCHVSTLMTEGGTVLHPYTDLLLHDMGDGSSDGSGFEEATETEFRTEPLWRLSTSAPYLHDGSAETIVEAIETHGGEAASAVEAFGSLSASERADLMQFLNSL